MPSDSPYPPPGVVRALARRMRLADFTLVHPDDLSSRTLGYQAARMSAPKIVVLSDPPLAVAALTASSLAGLPVLTDAELIFDLAPEGAYASAAAWAPLAAHMAYLHRLEPRRWGRKWGLEGCRDDVAALLLKRWTLASFPRAQFLVSTDGLCVAFRYAPDMAAPMVWALARGEEAPPLESLAVAKRIPVVERASYAELIPKDLEVGSYLPEACWPETFEIMQFLFQLHRRRFRTAWGLGQDATDDEGEEWKRG